LRFVAKALYVEGTEFLSDRAGLAGGDRLAIDANDGVHDSRCAANECLVGIDRFFKGEET
jgi:hypothetical protein